MDFSEEINGELLPDVTDKKSFQISEYGSQTQKQTIIYLQKQKDLHLRRGLLQLLK